MPLMHAAKVVDRLLDGDRLVNIGGGILLDIYLLVGYLFQLYVALAPPQNCALHTRPVIRMPFAEMLSPGESLVGVSGRMNCVW